MKIIFNTISRVMKLTCVFFIVSVGFAFATGSYAQNTVITMNLSDRSVAEVLETIESETEFNFYYNSKLVNTNRLVSVHVNNKHVYTVLEQLFSGHGVYYKVIDKDIILTTTSATGSNVVVQSRIGVSGTVTDANGEPVIGANVKERGTTNGTITDADGAFSFAVSPGATLEISYIGYVTKEVPIGNNTQFSITLDEDTQVLDEVVVVGYGTARKSDLTGAISSIKGESLTNRSTQQLSTAMQGQMAGVQVTRDNGAPGASATVRVRGITTLSNNDPLVIVDGVPSSLNDVISADVETMTVLKDAASASIYGSRAAAGVILITTKRAKDRQFSFDYNYEYGIDRPTTKPRNGDVIDWMNVQNEIKWNDGSTDPYSMYSQETIDSWMSNHATDPYHYPNTDWVNLILKESTAHEQHALSISGGTEKLRTKSTFNYQKGDGYYENKSYERLAGRVNNDYLITDWLRANIDFDFSKSNAISPSQVNAIYWAYLASPYYTPYWEDGRYADSKDGANAVAGLREGGRNKTSYYKFGGKVQLDLTPMKGLTLTAIFAPRYQFTKGKKFSRAVPVYYENGSIPYMQSHKTTSLEESRNDNNSQTYQFYGNYQNSWGDHSFSAMVGYEGYSYKWENEGASRSNYLLDTYSYLNIGPEDYQYNSGSAGHNAYESVFGRLMYSYKNKYMIQGNIRSDASSRFAKDYRRGTFYSASAGWVMSEESWFKNDLVDYLKIRGSIGQLGNERIGSEFPYQAAISFGNS
ncbi:MAG: SusC/RagA family TonB-linked outer membrane protein, partial [Tannerella sp.]|nr:SusC/RagA family TonB-linked outer membrane protein [Tannerella sp.]